MTEGPTGTPPENMIDVRLGRIIIRDGGEQQWIYLTERGGERGFTIVIGTNEAREIHRVVTRLEPPRPMTHQLAFNAIEALGATIQGIDIVDLRDNTFYALVRVERDGEKFALDARPSDALALGLRAGCEIRVAESVLEQVRSDSGPDAIPEELPEHFPEGLGELGELGELEEEDDDDEDE